MIRIYAAIAAVALALAGWWYVQSLRSDLAVMTNAYGIAAKAAIDQKAELDRQLLERERVDGILAAREREAADIRKANGVLNDLLDDLKRDHEDVRRWADDAVPDAVRGLLNAWAGSGTDGRAEAVPAGAPAGADAGASGADPHERRPAARPDRRP